MEHRWGRRIAVDIPIQMGSVEASLLRRASLVNFSVSGALIRADFPLRLRSRIQIVLESPLREKRDSLSIAAFVAHNHRHGIGVKWCELGSPAVTEWLRAVTAAILAASSRLSVALLSAPHIVAHLSEVSSSVPPVTNGRIGGDPDQNIAHRSSHMAADRAAVIVSRERDRST
jgi:hypothetical protein